MLGPVVILAAGLSQASAQSSSLTLLIDSSTTTLLPNTSGQVVRILLQNTGPAFPVVGGTFYFQVDDGDPTINPAPGITAVNLINIAGNPFTTANVSPSSSSIPGDEFWEVSFTTLPDPSNPSDPLVPVNLTATSTYTFAEVTVDTSGFSTLGQSWSFGITGLVSGNPYFDIEDPGNPANILSEYPQASNGTLQIGVVPIPEAVVPAGGVGLVGFALLSSVWRRRRSDSPQRTGAR